MSRARRAASRFVSLATTNHTVERRTWRAPRDRGDERSSRVRRVPSIRDWPPFVGHESPSMRGRTLLLYCVRVGRRARARLALVVAPRLDRDRRAPGRAVRGPGLAAAGTTTQTTVACCVARAEGGGGEGGARAPSRSSVAACHPLVPSSRSSRVAAGAIHIYIYLYVSVLTCQGKR